MSASENLSPEQFKTFYHGTKAKNVESIRDTGLTSSNSSIYPAKWYMLTDRKDEAGHYAGGKGGAVLTYHVPNEQVEEHLWPGSINQVSEIRAIKKPLPGNMIHHVDYL